MSNKIGTYLSSYLSRCLVDNVDNFVDKRAMATGLSRYEQSDGHHGEYMIQEDAYSRIELYKTQNIRHK